MSVNIPTRGRKTRSLKQYGSTNTTITVPQRTKSPTRKCRRWYFPIHTLNCYAFNHLKDMQALNKFINPTECEQTQECMSHQWIQERQNDLAIHWIKYFLFMYHVQWLKTHKNSSSSLLLRKFPVMRVTFHLVVRTQKLPHFSETNSSGKKKIDPFLF